MPEGTAPLRPGLTTRGDQPLIGIPTREGSDEVVHYFTSDEEADQAFAQERAGVKRALSLAGAWQHIDDEGGPDMLDELDRMRHETKPTPPFEL